MTTAQTAAEGSRVVVGVDVSESSKHALRWAQFIARASTSTLEVVAAWQPFTASGWMGAGWATMPTDSNPAHDAEKALTATIDEVLDKHRPAGLTLTVREGNAAQVLLEASEGARMLIVGSRRHSGFTGMLLGSVSPPAQNTRPARYSYFTSTPRPQLARYQPRESGPATWPSPTANDPSS